jgi:hypothetical protein
MWFWGCLIAFAGAVFAHAAIVRVSTRPAVVQFVVTGTVIGICWLGVVAVRYGWSPRLLASTLLFGFLCELYVFMFTLVANSVAVSLLLAVQAGRTSAEDIEHTYRPEAMVSRRLDQLERAGLIERMQGRLMLTTAGRRLVENFNRATRYIRPIGV